MLFHTCIIFLIRSPLGSSGMLNDILGGGLKAPYPYVINNSVDSLFCSTTHPSATVREDRAVGQQGIWAGRPEPRALTGPGSARGRGPGGRPLCFAGRRGVASGREAWTRRLDFASCGGAGPGGVNRRHEGQLPDTSFI